MELGQHLDQSPLVLQGAASTHAALLVFVVCIAVPGAPCVGRKEEECFKKIEGFVYEIILAKICFICQQFNDVWMFGPEITAVYIFSSS